MYQYHVGRNSKLHTLTICDLEKVAVEKEEEGMVEGKGWWRRGGEGGGD